MQQIDTIINAKWLIPIAPQNNYLTNHSIAIAQGVIKAIAPRADIQKQFKAKETIELTEHAVMPGFVNAHCHMAMTLLRGFADDLPLMDWLQNHIWPTEGRWVSAEMVADGTRLAIAEMLLSGVTCTHDMYFFPEVAAEACIKAGMRANLGIPCIEGVANAWGKDIDECIAKGLTAIKQYQNHPLVSMHFAPHAPYTVSDAYMTKIKQLAEQHDIYIQMHVHETAAEVEQGLEKDGIRPIERLHKLNMLGPRLTAIHLTQLTDEEIALLGKTQTQVVHCPESNLKLASGYCPVDKLQKAGVNVALGTDGAASNNDLDFIGEMRTAAILAKSVANNAEALPAAEALRMATLNGAKALERDKQTGSLEVGKQADITAIKLDELANIPMFNPISQIVYTATRQQVSDVWVAGKQLVKNRELTTIDVPALKQKIQGWQQRLSETETANA